MELKGASLDNLGSCKGGSSNYGRPNLSAIQMMTQLFAGHRSLRKPWHEERKPTSLSNSSDMLRFFAQLHLRDHKNSVYASAEDESCLQVLNYTDREWRVSCATMTTDEIKEAESLFCIHYNETFLGEALPFICNIEVSFSWALGLIIFQHGKKILELSSSAQLPDVKQLKGDHERLVSQCVFVLQATLSAANLRSHAGIPFVMLEHNVGHFIAPFITAHRHFVLTMKMILDCPEFNSDDDSLFACTLTFLMALIIENLGEAALSFSPSFIEYSLLPLLRGAVQLATHFSQQEQHCYKTHADHVLGMIAEALGKRLTGAESRTVPSSLQKYLGSGMRLFDDDDTLLEYQIKFNNRFLTT